MLLQSGECRKTGRKSRYFVVVNSIITLNSGKINRLYKIFLHNHGDLFNFDQRSELVTFMKEIAQLFFKILSLGTLAYMIT